MNLKAIIQTIVSWFKGEAKAVEQEAIVLAEKVGNEAWELTKDGALKILSDQLQKDVTMSTPAATPAAGQEPHGGPEELAGSSGPDPRAAADECRA